MGIFKLGSPPIEQIANIEGFERKLGDWVASQSFAVRLVVYSDSADLRAAIAHLLAEQQPLTALARSAEPLLREIDRLLNGEAEADPSAIVRGMDPADLAVLLELFPDEPLIQAALMDELADMDADPIWLALADALDIVLWRLPWLKDQVRLYAELQRKHLRRVRYLLITWEPEEISAQTIATTLQAVIERPVTILDQLPSILPGPYLKEALWLRPEQPGQPCLAGMVSYEIQGTLDAGFLHTLLDARFQVYLAIDIQTYRKDKAKRVAEFAYNSSRLTAGNAKLMDTRAVGVKASAERVLFELKHQGLHTVQLAVMVGGETPEELESNLAETKGKLGTQVQWMRPPGQQGEIARFWSVTPRGQIEAPLRPKTSLSHGVGCLLGVVSYHRRDTVDGTLLGVDMLRRAPLIVKLADQHQAFNMVILGMPGYGKTMFLNLMTQRAAVTQNYKIIALDDFDNGPRVERAADGGAICEMLSMNEGLNILDIVYSDEDGEVTGKSWLANQVLHVIGQMALLLGKPGQRGNKAVLLPRDFTSEETGALSRALRRVYAGKTPQTPLSAMPLLSDLIAVLETFHEQEAQRLARTLKMTLFGAERDEDRDTEIPAGACFNRHTTIDWNFAHDITYFNTYHVSQQYRPFFYLQVIGAILRYMRDPNRDRSRKTLICIDEFWYVTRTEAVAELAALICKVARKYGLGLVAIDQNPATFLESEHGRFIFDTSPYKGTFRLDEKPARELADAVRDMNEAHVAAATAFQPGQCLLVIRNDIYLVNVETSAREFRAFNGS